MGNTNVSVEGKRNKLNDEKSVNEREDDSLKEQKQKGLDLPASPGGFL